MRRRGGSGEQGSALVLVLVLLIILSLALGAMFADAGANLATSGVITSQDNKIYAADAGVEVAIQQLRANNAPCSALVPPPLHSLNGRDVTLSCQTRAGMVTSVSPWAVVATDTGGTSLAMQGGTISGPVYVTGGVKFTGPVTVASGLYQFSPSCPASPSPPPNFTGPLTCTTAAVQDPSPVLPPFNFPDRGPSPAFTLPLPAPGCNIFLPGRYKNERLTLHGHSYFASGLYYFENTVLQLQGDAFGGQPGPGELTPVITSSEACASDREVGKDDGSGVEFILGGASTIDVGSNDMELYSRIPGSTPEGAAGVSIRTVPTSAQLPYTPYSASSSVNVLTMATGAHLAVHGMVYTPQGSVNLFATNPVAGDLLGGLECYDLNAGPSASDSNGTLISAQSGEQPRYVVITATVQPTGSEQPITSTAVVGIGNDPARTITIQSWITSRP